MLNQIKSYPLYKVLSKDTIESEIVPSIPIEKEDLNQKYLFVRLLTVFYINLKQAFNGIFYLSFSYSAKNFFIIKQSLVIIVNGVKLEYGNLVGVVFYKRINQKLIYPAQM